MNIDVMVLTFYKTPKRKCFGAWENAAKNDSMLLETFLGTGAYFGCSGVPSMATATGALESTKLPPVNNAQTLIQVQVVLFYTML